MSRGIDIMNFNYSHLKSQLQQYAANKEPEELTQLRQRAFQNVTTAQLPKVTKFNFQDWPLISEQSSPLQFPKVIEQLTDPDQVTVKASSEEVTVVLPNSSKEQGVIISELGSAIKTHPEILTKYLATVIRPDENLLAAYHTAFINQGLFVYVPRNVELKKPIHLTINFNQTVKGTINFHLLIVAGENSRFQIIDHLVSSRQQTNPLTNFVEIMAEENSEVHFSSLDHLAQQSPSYYQYRAAIKNYAKVDWAIGLMNECNTVGEIDSELVGQGAYANSQLIALTANDQQLGINNRVTNRSPHSQGLINQRGVALGNSRLIFNGIGQIVHGAHGSEAEQQNRLLMMSPHATGDANPILLIDENDVEAGHAASVGKINQDQLYYLLSRGIPLHQAQRMVIRGFLSAVITAVPDKNVRQEMVDILERKLLENA